MKHILILAALLLTTGTARAAEEPFGQNIGPWRFTQQDQPRNVVLCRAYLGDNRILRWTSGAVAVSVPANGIPPATYRETFFSAAGESEPVNATANAQRLTLNLDEGSLAHVVRGRGFQWRLLVNGSPRSGTIGFDQNVGAAVARLRECSRANGGR
ncbi:hypothetical protein EOD42_05575 [Rhodovarius crocodyli]|uniref:Invasion associated locus B family protein n=1 Tax=Rhodovarius crocodyli TaxID=1979269 RepID=A0A437MPI7_9PROT|nr:hypothetical protein [Rhodovarius crocodyli]RVT99553.1 hypothetical protein EOD42_05575 [Rhodovarius crocodyli]